MAIDLAKEMIKKIKLYYNWGGRLLNNPYHVKGKHINFEEDRKKPFRSEVINYLLDCLERETTYLEIGVRNPADNFERINSTIKYSVDPGVEFKENPVDYKMTSDEFFKQLKSGYILSKDIKFDVIFIDGLHLAEQVERDIENSLEFIKPDGFIVLHDCNPPTEWHAREEFHYDLSPARNFWNGTTWKAFFKYRQDSRLSSICIDTDWGVGVLTKQDVFNRLKCNINPYFEFNKLNKNRKESLNLTSYDEFKSLVKA